MKIPNDKIDQAFQQALQQQIFSGAQIIAGRGDQTLFSQCYGRHSSDLDADLVTPDSIFDIASLTKAVATTTLMMQAVEAGKISLKDRVEDFFPQWHHASSIRIHHLLSHSSGLPDWLPLYQNISAADDPKQVRAIFLRRIFDAPLSLSPVGFWQDFFLSIKKLSRTTLLDLHASSLEHRRPGYARVYSDLGFILLGFILEQIHGESLDALFTTKVSKPLGLERIFFNPRVSFEAQKFMKSNFVATENCPWRGFLVQGEVHDENCYALGGVAGHAGLFSTASDLEKFSRALLTLNRGSSKIQNSLKISPKVFQDFVSPGRKFKLGWDTVSPGGSQAGNYFSAKTIGHLGFTGCSLWIDLEDEKYVILLTNRVHSSRHSDAIKQFRPLIHDLLGSAIFLRSIM